MHLSKAIAVGIATILPITLASPILEGRQNGVTCQTSSASPLTGDVTAVINQVNGKGGDCNNGNSKASDCTTLAKSGSAAITICGGEETISCTDVAGYADQIQQTCLNGAADDPSTLTGGTYTISASLRVEVISSSSV